VTVSKPHPVVLLGGAHAEEAEPAELVDHLAVEVRPTVPFRGERLDLGAREFARQLDDLTLRLGEARRSIAVDIKAAPALPAQAAGCHHRPQQRPPPGTCRPQVAVQHFEDRETHVEPD